MNIEITDITIKITKPLNILPDGTMDESKHHWQFGGTSFIVSYQPTYIGTPLTVEVQQVNSEWYDPCYQFHHKSLKSLIDKVAEIDYSMFMEYCNDD